MKKLLLLSVFALCNLAQAQLNNRRLVVPEFGGNTGNNKVKTYVPAAGNTMVVDPAFTINFSTLGNGLATAASPNCVAMNGSDLYVTLTFANQRVYKFPNYGQAPATAIANVSQVTNLSSEYVGIAFDALGNMYTSEGAGYNDTQLVKYSGVNLATRTVLGNGGITSYFANITFDGTGNMWASDYRNNRIVCIPNSSLTTTNAPMKQLVNPASAWNISGASLSNTNSTLNSSVVNYAFTSPEGVAFDSTGGLWVANNNDGNSNGGLINSGYATLVRISPGLQATILAGTSTLATSSLLNNTNGLKVWNVPNSASGRSQLGGMQIDKVTDRIYVNEQKSLSGLYFDIASINAITPTHATYQLAMTSTNPGNGGIYLASNTQVLDAEKFDMASNDLSVYPNPSNGSFKIDALQKIDNAVAFDILGKQIQVAVNGNDYSIQNANKGMYFLKITFDNGAQTTKKVVVN
jgi:Secretion system C-terminal sorting domain